MQYYMHTTVTFSTVIVWITLNGHVTELKFNVVIGFLLPIQAEVALSTKHLGGDILPSLWTTLCTSKQHLDCANHQG